jgi:hypothetical protein
MPHDRFGIPFGKFRLGDQGMISKTFVAAAAYMVVASATPIFAQSHPTGNPTLTASSALSGTEQENAACRRDTRRLCRHIKAGEGNSAFLSCLQEHRAKLSKACRAVLESHGM